MSAQADDDIVEVVDGEHDPPETQFAGAFSGSALTAGGVWNLVSSTMAVRGPQHGDVGTDGVKPDDAVHPRPLDLRLAFQLHAELAEECLGRLKVLDDDENVVQCGESS